MSQLQPHQFADMGCRLTVWLGLIGSVEPLDAYAARCVHVYFPEVTAASNSQRDPRHKKNGAGGWGEELAVGAGGRGPWPKAQNKAGAFSPPRVM